MLFLLVLSHEIHLNLFLDLFMAREANLLTVLGREFHLNRLRNRLFSDKLNVMPLGLCHPGASLFVV